MDDGFLFDINEYCEYQHIEDLSGVIKDKYKILIDAGTERYQERIYNFLLKEGIECQLLTS